MSSNMAAAVALAVYLIGLAAAFGWQTLTHWRATGSTGYRGISGQPGSLQWWGGILFPAALLLGAAAPILVLTGVTAVPAFPGRRMLSVVGLLIALTGIAVTLAAQRQMGASWRIGVNTGERTALVTDGLFAHIRNPIFTGMLAVTLGLAGMVPTTIGPLTALCLLAALQIQVRAVEEPYLIASHHEDYRGYAARAGRFLPGIGRLTPSPSPH
ncbi:isoprenylcysteine carboxylmethyltransferase family protein [Actinoplanes sp. NPDC049118]|uniref:methyltransferase family protein n=1 Tax=Actinoplanes sp. NPDC049118 TaxID=3155769 RepID=UPI00340446EC